MALVWIHSSDHDRVVVFQGNPDWKVMQSGDAQAVRAQLDDPGGRDSLAVSLTYEELAGLMEEMERH